MLVTQSSITQSYTSPCLTNWEALEKLEHEKDWLSALFLIFGSTSVVGGVYFSLVWLLILPPFAVGLRRLQKVAQLIRHTAAILEKFEEQGVLIYPQLEIPGYRPLDLFVKFPTKEMFAISIRSIGESKILYNEHNQTLCFRRKKGGLKKWNPDPLQELGEYEFWLRKNRQDLFGKSSKDQRRPLVKVLVFGGQTQIGEHKDNLYSMVGDQKILTIRRKGTINVLSEDQVTNFIEAYLANKREN